jgi:hypothetical protein
VRTPPLVQEAVLTSADVDTGRPVRQADAMKGRGLRSP